MHKNKNNIIVFAFIAILCSSCADRQFTFVIPWDDASESITNMSCLLKKPAGKDGFVFVNGEGHLSTASGRIRFWGVNMSFGACFPDHSEATKVAKHLAKLGVNLVRFHHMDMNEAPEGIWKSIEPDRVIDSEQLDRLDYFINALREEGIYSDINLLVSRPFSPGNELDPSIEGIFSEWSKRITYTARKTLLFFSKDIVELQHSYVRELLSHVNPYTGKRYSDESAIALIEPLNESGLVHAYLNGYLQQLPPFYRKKLAEKWNGWILSKYGTIESIGRAWKAKSFLNAVNHAQGSELTEDTIGLWNIILPPDKIGIEKYAPNGHSALSIKVDGSRKEPVVLLRQEIRALIPGAPYRFSFFLSTGKERKIIVRAKKVNEGEIKDTVLEMKVNFIGDWSLFESEIIILDENTNIEVQIEDAGEVPDTIRIAFPQLLEALDLPEPEKIFFDGTMVRLFDEIKTRIISGKGIEDWFSFLLYAEEEYWKQEIHFLKAECGVKCPVMSTMASVSTPTIVSRTDVVCDTQYWSHPTFLGEREWDRLDWFLMNEPMVNYPEKSIITRLAANRQNGKPFIVAEYNHPYPNTFQAESFYLMSAYAALQDWDGAIVYSYSQAYRDWGSERIRNNFDIDQNPVKLCSFTVCGLHFLRGDINKAISENKFATGRQMELDLIGLKRDPWKVVDARLAGLDQTESLKKRLSITTNRQEKALLTTKNIDNAFGRFESDTNEISWDVSKKQGGLFTLDAKKAKYLVGFADGSYDFGEIRIEPAATLQNGFCAISLSIIEGESFPDAKNVLVTAAGAVTNKDAKWYEYPDKEVSYPPEINKKITLRDKWGKFPTLVEGIEATITFQDRQGKMRAWSLDGKGKRVSELSVSTENGNPVIRIGPVYKTLWYEIVFE